MKHSYLLKLLIICGSLLLSNHLFAISGPSFMCLGSSITLSDPVPGGIWTSSNTAIATVGSSTGIVTGVTSGVVYISYTGSSSSFYLRVRPLPSPILGKTNICISDTAHLYTMGGGWGWVSVTWSSSNTAIATIGTGSGIVTGVSLGTATITYNDSGCNSTRNIIVGTPCWGTPSLDTATASTMVACAGTPVDLSLIGYALGVCGVDYQWESSPDGTSWTAITGSSYLYYTVYPTTSTYYRCKTTCLASGLSSYSIPVFIYVNNFASAYVVNPPDTICNALNFHISTCGVSPTYNVTIHYGDGTSDNTPLTTSAPCQADVFHIYNFPGVYSIREVIYNGTMPVDSVSFSYNYTYCHTLPIKLFYDLNNNCVNDAGETAMYPMKIRVDSNGVIIDTVSVTSGLYYRALGGPGTVYAFRLVPNPWGAIATCPASGILYDTIQLTVNNYPVKELGITWPPGTYDLQEYITSRCGIHRNSGTILIENPSPTPQNATITLNTSPKFRFSGSTPAPTSTTGNTITWNITGICVSNKVKIVYDLESSSSFLPLGDTVHSNCTADPIAGDSNPINNFVSWIDTAKSSFDPNYIEVSPEGYIRSGTMLTYTIHFENTGNDTAHNIYLMDTLSDHVDIHTLDILAASAQMDIAIANVGGHNIVKFDFPNIKLLDSSHHGLCDGVVFFKIKAKDGLPNGTKIYNQAGIYFDINPVVMTNTVENIICNECAPTGLQSISESVPTLYPNPTIDELTIKTANGSYTSLTISNSIGQVMMQQAISNTLTKVNVKALPAGLYYVTVKGDNGNSVQKFVKL